jgi:hydrophobic/amphiphilic exporter-1 (mainly G- bacteria), HAE1 family
MTSFAFILGCVPLWRASGSGAISRRVMGTAVIGGMLAASAIAIFIIPSLFYMIERLGGAKVEARVPEGTGRLDSSPQPPGAGH